MMMSCLSSNADYFLMTPKYPELLCRALSIALDHLNEPPMLKQNLYFSACMHLPWLLQQALHLELLPDFLHATHCINAHLPDTHSMLVVPPHISCVVFKRRKPMLLVALVRCRVQRLVGRLPWWLFWQLRQGTRWCASTTTSRPTFKST